jgi:metal-dependent amidase/aminoacylase/carboxypeptidase family protein
MDLLEIRHALHAHPQIRFEETFASELVQRHLTELGIEYRIQCNRVGSFDCRELDGTVQAVGAKFMTTQKVNFENPTRLLR